MGDWIVANLTTAGQSWGIDCLMQMLLVIIWSVCHLLHVETPAEKANKWLRNMLTCINGLRCTHWGQD